MNSMSNIPRLTIDPEAAERLNARIGEMMRDVNQAMKQLEAAQRAAATRMVKAFSQARR